MSRLRPSGVKPVFHSTAGFAVGAIGYVAIAMRRSLTANMGGAATGIAIFIACAWAVKDVARVAGDLMTNAEFAKQMVFGVTGAFYILAAVGCVLAARRSSAGSLNY